MKQKLKHENLVVGEVLGRTRLHITQDLVQECAGAIGGPLRPWYDTNPPFDCAIAPPTVFENWAIHLLEKKFARSITLHAAQRWEFKAPIRVDTIVNITATLEDRTILRGKPYIVIGVRVNDPEGIELCRGFHTSMVDLQCR